MITGRAKITIKQEDDNEEHGGRSGTSKSYSDLNEKEGKNEVAWSAYWSSQNANKII